MTRSIFLFFSFLLICRNLLTAQTLPSTVNIKTPEVSAFNKDIETPVSLYSGTANVSIPLFTINIKDVSVPITLDYSTGGVRVDQEATFVGLGWKLNYGGEISRKVKGTPDERYFISAAGNSGSIDYYKSLPYTTQDDISNRLSYISQAKFGSKDFMPDEFYYSALGSSGRFMFSQEQNKFMLFPKDDIDVQASMPSLSSWTLTMANGVVADFGQDAIVSQDDLNGVSTTRSDWLIKQIRNTSNQSINYSYEQFDYSLKKITSVEFAQHWISNGSTGTNGPTQNVGFSQFNYHDVRITSINFPEGTASFVWSTRDDMPTKKLSEIDITDFNGNLVKKIIFNYSYFLGTAGDILPVIGFSGLVPSSYNYNRLKLNNVQITGTDGSTKTYSFGYYENGGTLPAKYSYAQDHFGYYNGAANNTWLSFIPNIAPNYFQGGDRSINPSVSNVFALNSITYPEGGNTVFEYENNEAAISNIPSALLETYQDANIVEKQAGIGISSYSRNTSNPSPTYTNNGIRYFTQQFTVANGAFVSLNNGWYINTNFGVSDAENNLIYYADNADFKLERIENGSPVLVKEFNTTSQSFPCNPACPRQGSDQSQLFLTPGLYQMTVALTYSNPNDNPSITDPYNLSFIIKWREIDPAKNSVYVGGLRIKNIKYYTEATHLVKQKSYQYVNPYANPSLPNFTSGRVVSFPEYYQYRFRRTGSSNGYDIDGIESSIDYASNSYLPLETTCGSYSGYEYVDEYDVDYTNSNNNMRTNYHFSFAMPYFSSFYSYLNLGAWEPAEWTRGKLKTKLFYKNGSIIKQEDYTYYDWSPHLSNGDQEDYVQEINTNLISNTYVTQLMSPESTGAADFYDNPPPLSHQYNLVGQTSCIGFNYGIATYFFNVGYPSSVYPNIFCQSNLNLPYFLHYTAFDKMKSKTVTTYDDNRNSIVETENYYYDKTPNLNQLTRTESINSKKENFSNQLTYPLDYALTAPYNEMLQRHILSRPVMQSLYKSGSTFLKSTKTNYYDWGNNIIAPISQEEQIGSHASAVRVQVNAYDNIGNVREVQKANDVKHTYIWGYSNLYPVADITGVDYATAIATSNLNQATLNAPPDDVTLRAELNKIRQAFPTALVTTYTYKPLIGITSQTDPTGKTSYYEYDGMGRLSLIRDKDGNILKKFCYNYAGQPQNCQ